MKQAVAVGRSQDEGHDLAPGQPVQRHRLGEGVCLRFKVVRHPLLRHRLPDAIRVGIIIGAASPFGQQGHQTTVLCTTQQRTAGLLPPLVAELHLTLHDAVGMEDIGELLLEGHHLVVLQFIVVDLQRTEHLTNGQLVCLGYGTAIMKTHAGCSLHHLSCEHGGVVFPALFYLTGKNAHLRFSLISVFFFNCFPLIHDICPPGASVRRACLAVRRYHDPSR